jgi:hypothetical protein
MVGEEILKWSCGKISIKEEDGKQKLHYQLHKQSWSGLRRWEKKHCSQARKTIDKDLVKIISHNKLYNGRKETKMM